MALEPVKFSIIASGAPEAKAAIKSIEEYTSATALRIKHLQENNAQRIVEIEKTKAKQIADINNNQVLSAQSKANKIVSIEEKASHRIETIHARESLRKKQIQERSFLDAEQGYSNHLQKVESLISSFAGNSKITKSLMNFGSFIDFGGSSSGASSAMSGGSAAAGVGAAEAAAVAIPLAVVGGAVLAAGTLVKTTLSLIADGLQYTAGQFTDALLQIGGAENITTSILNASKNNRAAQTATYSVTGDEIISAKDVKSRADQLASDANAGGFKTSDWIEAQAENAKRTGKLKSVSMEDLKESGQLALAAGATPKEIASFKGLLSQTNPDASKDQLKQLLRDMVVQGQKGAFGIEDLIQNPEIISGAGNFGGDRLSNIRTGTTLLSLAKGQGATGSTANTGITQLDKQIAVDIRQGGPTYGAKLNKGGQITNRLEAEIEALSLPLNKLGKHLLASTEAMNLRNQIRGAAGVNDNDTYDSAKAKIAARMQQERVEGVSGSEFDKRVSEASGPEIALKAAFNKLSIAVGDQLYPELIKLIPHIEQFVNSLVANGGNLKDTLLTFAESAKLAVEAIGLVGIVGIQLSKVFLNIIGFLGENFKVLGYSIATLMAFMPGMQVASIAMFAATAKFGEAAENIGKASNLAGAGLDSLEKSIHKTMDTFNKPPPAKAETPEERAKIIANANKQQLTDDQLRAGFTEGGYSVSPPEQLTNSVYTKLDGEAEGVKFLGSFMKTINDESRIAGALRLPTNGDK
jgi:hypothetical protein